MRTYARFTQLRSPDEIRDSFSYETKREKRQPNIFTDGQQHWALKTYVLRSVPLY